MGAREKYMVEIILNLRGVEIYGFFSCVVGTACLPLAPYSFLFHFYLMTNWNSFGMLLNVTGLERYDKETGCRLSIV